MWAYNSALVKGVYGRASWLLLVAVVWDRGLLVGLADGLPPLTDTVGDDGPSADDAAFRSTDMFLRRWKPSPLSRIVT